MMMMNEGSLLCSCQRDDVPFRYIHPDMTLAKGEINIIRDENLLGLVARKKLQLVLDLDHTLIHSTKTCYLTPEERNSVNTIDDAYTFSCYNKSYVMKLRPGIREFLEQVSLMFDVSVYTLGQRNYAKEVHGLLVSKAGFPKGSWVISKEDCLRPRNKTLDVVLSHARAVLVVDDTEHVWVRSKRNLVTIGRYSFFPIKKGAEVDVDNELERVLRVLKGVHSEFYHGNMEGVDVDYLTRDVRPMLRLILSNLGAPIPCNKDRNGKDRKVICGSFDRQKRSSDDDKNNGSIEDNLSDVPIEKCSKLEESRSDNCATLVSCNEMQEAK